MPDWSISKKTAIAVLGGIGSGKYSRALSISGGMSSELYSKTLSVVWLETSGIPWRHSTGDLEGLLKRVNNVN